MLSGIKFRFDLECMTDLHIGTGAVIPLATLCPNGLSRNAVDDPTINVSVIARSFSGNQGEPGKPILPVTSLKGALRKRLGSEADKIFGQRLDNDSGQIGSVIFFPAVMKACSTSAEMHPYWEKQNKTFVGTHVAIDRQTGTASENKLFCTEYVPAGSTFSVEGVVMGNAGETHRILKVIAAEFACKGGVQLGAGTGNGHGVLKLVGDTVEVSPYGLDLETGEPLDIKYAALKIEPAKNTLKAREVAFQLHCKGPYASVDYSSASKHKTNKIPALRDGEHLPGMWPESLRGALRIKAAWLEAVQGNKNQDDPFIAISAVDDPAKLTSTQRLFGVGGWQGLVRVESLEPIKGERAEITSNRLDPLTSGVIDGNLFTHEVFIGAAFSVRLALLSRSSKSGTTYPLLDDVAFFDSLIEALKSDGLLIGHGTNKGFGWFDHKEVPKTGETK